MKPLLSSLLFAAVALLAWAAPEPAPEPIPFTAQELAQGYRQHVVLARPVDALRATVDAAEASDGVRVREIFPRFGHLRVIELNATDDAAAAIARLRATGRYEFVETDRILEVALDPNDPQFANGALWAMKNTGAANGVAGADIAAAAAWDVIREAPEVIVAIIDTGLNINHQDLAGNIWQNPNPTFGDTRGARFLNGARSGNVADDSASGHGTHVAGTIGAIGNNGLGVAGVAWRVQLMPLKAFNSSGRAATSDLVAAINYAIAHGAHIINGSYGDSGDTGFSQSQLAAIEAARAAGIIFVAAAGNSASNIDIAREFPASHAVDNIVTVGNSTRQDTVALSSNTGASVDLFAPGSEIISLDHNTNTGTRTLSGTSMAAPHVAGALALLKARFPADTYRQLINRLLRGVDRRDRFTGRAQTGGRLDVYNALIADSNRPFNDRFADRPRLTGNNLSLRTNNRDATLEAGEAVPGGGGGASLWWEWAPSANGLVSIDTAGSGHDSVIAIYTAAGAGTPLSPADLVAVATNDNDPTAPITTSRLNYTAQAGVTYYITVASRNGGGLTLLNIGTTAANDFFTGAQVLEGQSARVTSQNSHGSVEAGEPRIGNWPGGNSLWYRWTAPRTGRFQIAVVSGDFDPILGVYTGSALNSLALVAENDDAPSNADHTGSLCTIDAIGGTTYSIAVDSKSSALSGQFTLTIVDSLWQAATGDNLTGSPAAASDGTVYVGGTDGVLYAFSPAGVRLWSVITGGYIDSCSPAIANDGSVIVGSNDGKVYAFSATGSSRWTRDLGSAAPVSTSPAIATDGTIYIKAGDGYLYALEPATGAVRWRCDVHGPETYASPSIAPDGTVYQGSDDAKLYAVNPDGTVKWTFAAGQDIYTVPAIDAAGNVYFSVLITGELFCVSPAGALRWRYSGAAQGSSSSPALSADGGTVYFAGYDHKLHAVNAATGAARWTHLLGDEVRASSPAIDANGVVYVGCYDGKLYAIHADGTLKRTFDTGDWIRSSPIISGRTLYVGSNDAKLYAFGLDASAGTGPWPQYRQNARRLGRAMAPPVITVHPVSQNRSVGESVTFTVAATGTPAPSIQWQRNGSDLVGAIGASLTLSNLQPADAGFYIAVLSNGATITTEPVVLGVLTGAKAAGSASELAADIVHPNTNIYDQVRLFGPAATITADRGQIVRLSFVDLTNDIVQVEFSGAGALSIALDNASGPAIATSYNQPDVLYMKGHASIVVAGADETTNVSVFSVGRITAVDQTLFRSETIYDGVADIAGLTIVSASGRFGGIRTGNTSFLGTRGLTGIFAPGVQFTLPVIVGDISATDAATPVLLLGAATNTSIAGGDLFQSNGRAIRVSGLSALRFTAGTNSHGTLRPAQANQARLEQNGAEVTNQVVVNPSP